MNTGETPESRFPRQAPIHRRLLQLFLALCGWALFLYWWWLVLGRVSRTEIVYTAVFIAVTTVISVLTTAVWSLHNKRLGRRSQRNEVRTVPEDWSRDTLLRAVAFLGSAEQIKSDPFVQIAVRQNQKIYRPEHAAAPEHGEARVL